MQAVSPRWAADQMKVFSGTIPLREEAASGAASLQPSLVVAGDYNTCNQTIVNRKEYKSNVQSAGSERKG